MTPRILFVDDDATLLTAFARNLCFDYELRTAESVELGLQMLAGSEPFAVVLTDMKMPQMSGLQFIEKARSISPDTIFMMLTGNQDVNTAISAINNGSVFRFLNKPCAICDVKNAIDAALRQHELVNVEKTLLEDTFLGAVSVLTDVLESLRPDAMQQSQRVDWIMKKCEVALGGHGSWEYRMAGRVGLVGFPLLPRDDQQSFLELPPDDPKSLAILHQIALASARLLDHIPRLHNVSHMIKLQSSMDGSALQEELDFTSVHLGATLLRLAIHWTTLTHQRVPNDAAIDMLYRLLPNMTPAVESALISADRSFAITEVQRVALFELVEGMVLAEDVISNNGTTLLRKGRPLTDTVITKFHMHYRSCNEAKTFLVEIPIADRLATAC
jgi:ActR/RegA family two-component response regulator